jgi:diguanylate cyclase (GGDEF)-like protein
MLQEIYIINDNIQDANQIQSLFKDESFKIKIVKTEQIDIALRNIPSLIIVDEDHLKRDIIEFCKTIRANEDNGITPIIVLSSNTEKKHRVSVLETAVEYYIKKPIDVDYLYYTVKNIMRLMYVNRRVSPLTGLPGNVQILAELKKRVMNEEEFAVLYADLDHFKEYNDVYGFLKGDEIIKYTAKTIVRNVHSLKGNHCFVGHIGGDDFVAIVSKTDYEQVCQNILAEFDKDIHNFFTKDDLERGYLEVENRKGVMEQFPLTSLSIGVVEADKGRFKNILEIGEVGAQVKHVAKTIMGSSYAIDRRKK